MSGTSTGAIARAKRKASKDTVADVGAIIATEGLSDDTKIATIKMLVERFYALGLTFVPR